MGVRPIVDRGVVLGIEILNLVPNFGIDVLNRHRVSFSIQFFENFVGSVVIRQLLQYPRSRKDDLLDTQSALRLIESANHAFRIHMSHPRAVDRGQIKGLLSARNHNGAFRIAFEISRRPINEKDFLVRVVRIRKRHGRRAIPAYIAAEYTDPRRDFLENQRLLWLELDRLDVLDELVRVAFDCGKKLRGFRLLPVLVEYAGENLHRFSEKVLVGQSAQVSSRQGLDSRLRLGSGSLNHAAFVL